MPVLLLLCFVISGASSLVLEVVWSRQLTQVFGSTTLAISTVLATFMGGLALGSWLGGRLADRLRHDPLLAYALCELGIAACALGIPVALGGYPEANAWLWRTLADRPALLAGARFFLCALVLLPPTTMMGATLPLLARRVIRTPAEFGLLGQRIGALYAANTAGAVLGAGGAGFYLIPTIGVRATNLVAVAGGAGLAVAIGGALLLLRRRRAAAPQVEDPDTLLAPTPEVAAEAPLRSRLALWAFALSGGVAMTLEVLWSRALALIIGSSIYSFTLVLVVFLLGLGAGAAWIGRPAARAKNPLGALAIVFLAAGASVALTHLVLDELPYVFIFLLQRTEFEVSTILLLQAVLTGMTVLPTAACLGAVMPLAVRAYVGSAEAVGRDVGRAYAANTTGAIVGSFAGGFLVLPLVGLENGVRACALADLALAGLLVWAARTTSSRRLRRVTVVLAPALALWVILAPRWDVSVLTSGVFRISLAGRSVAAGKLQTAKVLYYRDGVSTTVTVEEYSGHRLALKNNGKVEASSIGDMPTQILVGLLPVLLHPAEQLDVAVVGYGSGVTVGAIAAAPTVERVDVVELEPAVYEAADRWFSDHNHRPQDDPKVHRWLGDGRNFLTSRSQTYDLIVSEPSNPWIAGVASLFTREFYAFARRHLATGGIFCQWVQLYELGPSNVKTIYKTFHEAFPYVYAFVTEDQSADTVLIGSLEPLPIAVARLEARSRSAAVLAELSRARVAEPLDLLAMLILAPDEIPAFAAGGRINTDDNALLEFSAPRDLLASGRATRFADVVFSHNWPYGHLDTVLADLGEGADRGRREARLAHRLYAHGRRREGATWLTIARQHQAPADELAEVAALAALVQMRGQDDYEVHLDAGGTPLGVASPDWFAPETPLAARLAAVDVVSQAMTDLAATRWARALARVEELPALAANDGGRDLRLLHGYLLYQNERFGDAAVILEKLCATVGFVDRRPAALYYLGRSLYGNGEFANAAGALEQFARLWPALVPG